LDRTVSTQRKDLVFVKEGIIGWSVGVAAAKQAKDENKGNQGENSARHGSPPKRKNSATIYAAELIFMRF
jgi:hypothetical protein